jgi:hypothetical protein
MNTEQMIDKLAEKLDDQELGLLAHVMSKVAENAAFSVVTAEQQREALIDKLASSGFSMQEIQGELQKMAEEKATQDECEKIAKDCLAMGTIIGNTASDVFLNNIRGFISKHAEEDEEEEEEEMDPDTKGMPPEMRAKAEDMKKKKKEEEEEEEEKEASNRDALRSLLLQAASL